MVGDTNTVPVKTATPVATQPATTAAVTPVVGEKKSIFKTWWFWTIIAVVVIAIVAGILLI